MASDKADEGLTKEALEQALTGQTDDQLREMGRRLAKSNEDLQAMLEELQAEKVTLTEEKEYLDSTIDLIMKELHKLNIGAMNTVEPQLEEGPLDFVGRLWEKVKPRDTAYQTSEHVGEIRKPVAADGPTQPPTAQELAHHAQQQVVQTAQRLQTVIGPWWQKTQGFLSEKQNEIVGAVAARAKQRQRSGQEQREAQQGSAQPRPSAKRQAGGYPEGGAAEPEAAAPAAASSSSAAAPAAPAPAPPPAPTAPAPPAAKEEPAAPSSPPGGKAAKKAAKQAAAAAAPQPPVPQPPAPQPPAPEPEKPKKEVANGAGPEAEAPAPAAPAAAPAAEDQTSTILIEAQLKVDDGSVLTLRVRAADRCKEVAQRFVQEHSLKAWFQEPLTAWLKKVEADAVKFPVMIEADLQEIRKQYAKSK